MKVATCLHPPFAGTSKGVEHETNRRQWHDEKVTSKSDNMSNTWMDVVVEGEDYL